MSEYSSTYKDMSPDEVLISAMSGVSCGQPVLHDCPATALGWSPQDHAPVRAAEVSDEGGSARWPDLNVRAEGGER